MRSIENQPFKNVHRVQEANLLFISEAADKIRNGVCWEAERVIWNVMMATRVELKRH